MNDRISFFLLLFLGLIGWNSLARAISEVDYPVHWKQEVMPYYSSGISGQFIGKAGVNIAYRKFLVPSERGRLVISPGSSEPIRKYAEVIYDLKDLGFSVFILEHRGQGESGRMLADSEIHFVESFDDYVEDFSTFIDTIVRSESNSKLFLLAHSMGAAIASLYSIQNPTTFEATVLSSPMFEVNTSPYPEGVAYLLVSLGCKLGYGQSYAPGSGPYVLGNAMPLGSVTMSVVRHQMTENIFINHPETRLGGVSYQWVLASFGALATIAKSSSFFVNPVLLLQAGDDTLVRSGAQDQFCKNVKRCEKIVFPQARHEILMERDFIRNAALGEIKGFFKR